MPSLEADHPSPSPAQGGDLFRVTIPRMKFFSVWIEPMVEVTVRISADEVLSRGIDC